MILVINYSSKMQKEKEYYYCFVDPICSCSNCRNPRIENWGYFESKEEAEKERKRLLKVYKNSGNLEKHKRLLKRTIFIAQCEKNNKGN